MNPDPWQTEEYFTWQIKNSPMIAKAFTYLYLKPYIELIKVTQKFMEEKTMQKQKKEARELKQNHEC